MLGWDATVNAKPNSLKRNLLTVQVCFLSEVVGWENEHVHSNTQKSRHLWAQLRGETRDGGERKSELRGLPVRDVFLSH